MAKSKITSEIAGRGDKNNVCTVTQEQDGYCIHCSADTAGGGYHIDLCALRKSCTHKLNDKP